MVEEVQDAINDPYAFALKELKARSVKTLYLCLVCELCWMPQPKGYLVTVQSEEWRSEECRKIMPMAKATLSTINALNGVAGLAQCFFPMVPTLPQSALNQMTSTIDQLNAESSVAEFPQVQKVLAEAAGEPEQGKQTGYCLRQFKQLLPNHKVVSDKTLPEEVYWVEAVGVSKDKNQGQCGSCRY